MKIILVTLAAVVAASPALADPRAGRTKAAMCQVCHGYDGIGTNPEVPNIGGESEYYITKQLRAFRSGQRQHQQMSIVAQSLTDTDIDNLADYYAAIEVSTVVPEF